MNPPRFKINDMVIALRPAAIPRPFVDVEPRLWGKIMTITGAPFPCEAGVESWRYPTDTAYNPVEFVLRLIRAGDLNLEDTPADLKEPA